MLRGLFHTERAVKSPDTAQISLARYTGLSTLKTLNWAEVPPFRFDTLVICFAIGIALYFTLPFSVFGWVLGLAIGLVGALLWMTRQTAFTGWVWGAFLLAMLLGAGRAGWHTQATQSPRLPDYERAYELSGWIEEIAASGKGVRWIMNVEEFNWTDGIDAPEKVRVRLGQKYNEAASAGDYVSLRAVLSAPPGPVVPGGYSPRQRAFFEQVGGFGFAISAPEVRPEAGEPSWRRGLAAFRYRMASHIHTVAPSETAGLQAALLTGVRRYIPPEHTDALRTAGLAHILAISGLHMGLLAGTAYWIFTFLLVHISPLSRRYDVRKFAAILGIGAATGYLILSGASVATQRAYIMAVIVFLAVILNRRAISVRSVSVAAAITLLLHPEALLSVGFQMSFAAVLALVVVYRSWRDFTPGGSPKGWLTKLRNDTLSLSVTSFVAGLATAGFALFHFGRIARFGLVGNLLAMPLFTFAVMPLGILSLVLMPVGLEEAPLWAMGQAITGLVTISTWIASWDGALVKVKAAPGWVIAAYGFAFILLLLGRLRGRLIAVGLILLCFLGWRYEPVPTLRISKDGRVAFWESQDLQRLIVTSERADSYGRERFSEKAGRGEVDAIAMEKTDAPCDALACRFQIRRKQISILTHPSEARVECASSDLVILTERDVGPEVRRNCAAKLIDGQVLRQEGALDVYLEKRGIRREGTKKPPEKRRVWE
ncbi:ComEC/Rec2 family competence protein [Litorimonas haliclonae]|uniref:ComEC/Rec2 family competence protein n=1 Tax=Litorimonas haliclonae TaxID=2081977 RepID=UPI0039EE78F0